MKSYLLSMILFPCCLFGDLDSIHRELTLEMKIRHVELNSIEYKSPLFFKKAGEIEGLSVAIDLIEREIYGYYLND